MRSLGYLLIDISKSVKLIKFSPDLLLPYCATDCILLLTGEKYTSSMHTCHSPNTQVISMRTIIKPQHIILIIGSPSNGSHSRTPPLFPAVPGGELLHSLCFHYLSHSNMLHHTNNSTSNSYGSSVTSNSLSDTYSPRNAVVRTSWKVCFLKSISLWG